MSCYIKSIGYGGQRKGVVVVDILQNLATFTPVQPFLYNSIIVQKGREGTALWLWALPHIYLSVVRMEPMQNTNVSM